MRPPPMRLPHITPAGTDTLDVLRCGNPSLTRIPALCCNEKNADQQRPIASITKSNDAVTHL